MKIVHWMYARVTDPVGKLTGDLATLDFRRRLLLCISRENDGFAICVHKDCVDGFKNLEFFCQLGSEHDTILVEDRADAEKHGAHAYVCCCGKPANEPIAAQNFQRMW